MYLRCRGRKVLVRLLERREGDRLLRRKGGRARPGRGRAPLSGSCTRPDGSGLPVSPQEKSRRDMDVLSFSSISSTIGATTARPCRSHRPGSHRPRGDLRHPRPDARDDPGGDQAGPLDRQGAPGDARRGEAGVRQAARRGASRRCARPRRPRSSSSPSARRRTSSRMPAARRDAARDGGLGGRAALDARAVNSTGSLGAVRRGREAAARALAGERRRRPRLVRRLRPQPPARFAAAAALITPA